MLVIVRWLLCVYGDVVISWCVVLLCRLSRCVLCVCRVCVVLVMEMLFRFSYLLLLCLVSWCSCVGFMLLVVFIV